MSDDCTLQPAIQRFSQDGDFRQLLRALVLTDGFLKRDDFTEAIGPDDGGDNLGDYLFNRARALSLRVSRDDRQIVEQFMDAVRQAQQRGLI